MSLSAFEQGQRAYQHNMPMSACEFPVGSSLRAEWMGGWTGARHGEERRVHREPASGLMGDARRATHLGEPSARQS